jgi:transcriptional regulator with XRE-family HTH domain
MGWKRVDLKKWADDMGVDICEIDQKLKLRDMIVKLRTKQRLTQEELAERVGVSRSRIAQIENGVKLHQMSFDILLRVLQGFGYRYEIRAKKLAA